MPKGNGDVKTSRLPTYFLSHGGGPWPYMTGGFRSNFDKLEQSLIEMRAELQDLPKAVLVVSATGRRGALPSLRAATREWSTTTAASPTISIRSNMARRAPPSLRVTCRICCIPPASTPGPTPLAASITARSA
ncbi:hypothetical protein CUJ84_Chr000902 [Rhizobium leguminosarum]|uniref:Extradiol ring-cleavage dioxygenase class III enzyme subunit B domain-containing protein n=1 Tax=Rhizobium leguminosarum TaxID=384 RepID=A0A2K9YZ91_RHILE|nr:hypothetical protein CUJ84_Chr000902 [Rhizobium leguminosarum]